MPHTPTTNSQTINNVSFILWRVWIDSVREREWGMKRVRIKGAYKNSDKCLINTYHEYSWECISVRLAITSTSKKRKKKKTQIPRSWYCTDLFFKLCQDGFILMWLMLTKFFSSRQEDVREYIRFLQRVMLVNTKNRKQRKLKFIWL